MTRDDIKTEKVPGNVSVVICDWSNGGFWMGEDVQRPKRVGLRNLLSVNIGIM